MPEPLFCVPHDDPTHLVGRDDALRELHERLTTGDGPTLVAALQGTGGIGKTQLAARYCWQYRPSWPAGILWLSMADPARVLGDLAQLAERQGIAGDSDRAKANGILGRLAGRKDALLVLDNLEDPALLDRDLAGLAMTKPRGLGCRLLITSRQPELPGCRPLRLDFLPMPAARALLLREAEQAEPGGAEAAALRELLQMLGGLPLALVMTGRLMARRKGLGYGALARVLRSQGAVTVLTQHGAIPPDYHDKIGLSFEALLVEAWDALPPDQPMLRDILRSLGCLAENAFIPESVLPFMVAAPPADPLGLAPDPLKAGLHWLEDAQLLERNQAREARLHPLIYQFAQKRVDGPFLTATTTRILSVMADPERYSEAALPNLLRLAIELSVARIITQPRDEASAELAAVTRMLTAEAYNFRRGTRFKVGFSIAAQLAYAAILHGLNRLRERSSAEAHRRNEAQFVARWTTAVSEMGIRYKLHGRYSGILGCAISGDGRTGFFASGDAPVVWDLTTGDMHRLPGRGPRYSVWSFTISGDGRTALSISRGFLHAWDLANGKLRYCIRVPSFTALHEVGCSISSDGSIGLTSSNNVLIVWDLIEGTERYRISGHGCTINYCAISGDGQTAISADREFRLIVWDLYARRGEERCQLTDNNRISSICAISNDGKIGLSPSDNTLIIWDLTAGTVLCRLTGGGRISSCAISGDGEMGLSASGNVLFVWDIVQRNSRARLRGHDRRISGCSISDDGRTAISGSDRSELIVWNLDLANGVKPQCRTRDHHGLVLQCGMSSDGLTGLSSSIDRQPIVWDLVNGTERYRLSGYNPPIRVCAISGNGRIALSASGDQLIVWNLDRRSGNERYILAGHDSDVLACAISDDGRRALSASKCGLILWDLVSGVVRHRFECHDGEVQYCAIGRDGRAGFSLHNDGSLAIWDLNNLAIRYRHEHFNHGRRDFAISGDGRIGLCNSTDDSLAVWDLMTGEKRCRLQRHNDIIHCFASSNDGRIGLSGSEDCTIIIYDLSGGDVVSRLALDSVPITLAIDARARACLVGDIKGNVTMFDLVLP